MTQIRGLYACNFMLNCHIYLKTAYIKGRYIGENVRLILENIDGLLLFSYLKKCSTSLSGNFFKALQQFNISNNFIKWSNILYTKAIFKLKNNGWLSNVMHYDKRNSTRWPLSSLLCLFVAEILSIKINCSQNIQIITIINCKIKNIQNADDLS